MVKSAPRGTLPRAVTTAGKQGAPTSGTPLATIAYAPSCIVDPASRYPGGTWGGARNRADRSSIHLSTAAVTGMIEAAHFAECIGLAFNRHWTVHYEMAGIAEDDGAAFVGRLLTFARKHVHRAGGKLAALWARENGDGKGGHVHILLHVPSGITLRNLTRRWIKAAGGNPARRVSRVRTIGGTLASASVGDEHYQANADAVLAYLVKAASSETGNALALPRYGEGGRIIGKRCGTSQNIGAKARKARD
jgi:hypothetical protein